MKFHCHCLRPTLIFFLVTPQNCKDALIPSLCQWNRRVMKLCVCVAEQMVTKTRPDQSKAGLIDWWALTIMLKEWSRETEPICRRLWRQEQSHSSSLRSQVRVLDIFFFFCVWCRSLKKIICTLKPKWLPSTRESAMICRCDMLSCVCVHLR